MCAANNCIGVLVQDRWELTKLTLESILESSQDPASYDLFLIDNGSNEFNQALLKSWAENHNVCRNLFCFQSPVGIPIAWNLFLAFTSTYLYRTLMDNDIVLKGTGAAKFSENANAIAQTRGPGITMGTNPGAPKNASIVRGAGDIRAARRRTPEVVSSKFLDEATTYMRKYKIDMLSYVPVPTSYPFETMIKSFAQSRFRNKPFLVGGCVTISRRCLSALGYYDERLPRNVVTDYSQRAIASRINIGYHDKYWVAHNILDVPQADIAQEKRLADQILMADPKDKRHVETRWTSVIDKIQMSANATKIVNLK